MMARNANGTNIINNNNNSNIINNNNNSNNNNSDDNNFVCSLFILDDENSIVRLNRRPIFSLLIFIRRSVLPSRFKSQRLVCRDVR